MRSRNELAKWFQRARETGKISIRAVQLETCSLCCGPLFENEETDSDESGLYHRNPYLCIAVLQKQQRQLEELLDGAREMVNLLQHKRLLKQAGKAKNAPAQNPETV